MWAALTAAACVGRLSACTAGAFTWAASQWPSRSQLPSLRPARRSLRSDLRCRTLTPEPHPPEATRQRTAKEPATPPVRRCRATPSDDHHPASSATPETCTDRRCPAAAPPAANKRSQQTQPTPPPTTAADTAETTTHNTDHPQQGGAAATPPRRPRRGSRLQQSTSKRRARGDLRGEPRCAVVQRRETTAL